MEAEGLPSADPVREGGEDVDPWGSEDDDRVEHSPSSQSLELHREWETRRLQFHALGYRDGITAGNNSSVQEGFNVGFQEAVEPGFSWGVARGAASAYSSLPSSLKELLLKDREAGKRLEALHASMSSISSADAMGFYYKDTILRKKVTAEDSPVGHPSRSISSVETSPEEAKTPDESETGNPAGACCGGGSCGDSRRCNTQVGDGASTVVRHSTLDGSSPQSAGNTSVEESSGKEPVSEEVYKFILRVGTSSSDSKQLEDSTRSHLVSMALGQPDLSASTSRTFEASSRLEEYERNVSAELGPSVVKLSSFPQPSRASGDELVI